MPYQERPLAALSRSSRAGKSSGSSDAPKNRWGAGDHAGQDAQATQPDVVLFRGEPLLLAQKADLPKIRRPPPVALRRAWLYTLPVKRVF